MSFLYDQAIRNNALFLGVTETWLHEGVLDAEVTHSFPGYNILRSDRAGGRVGGGVAIYLRDDLTGDILATYNQTHLTFSKYPDNGRHELSKNLYILEPQ